MLEKSSGKLIAAEKSWSAPTSVPAVCSVGNLNLSKTSSPKEIQYALAWLEKYDGLVYVLLLLRVLQAKSIFSLNLGEAGKHLQEAHYNHLLRHLRTPTDILPEGKHGLAHR